MKIIRTIAALMFVSVSVFAQEQPQNEPANNFFSDMMFGGNLGVAFGNGFANVNVSPMAYKPVSNMFTVGTGLQFNYMKWGETSTAAYGLNLIGLFTPIPELQLSAEVEQLRINSTYTDINRDAVSNNFWNTGLFLGAGYNTGGVVVGMRYNVLHNNSSNRIYATAWVPFVRVMF